MTIPAIGQNDPLHTNLEFESNEHGGHVSNTPPPSPFVCLASELASDDDGQGVSIILQEKKRISNCWRGNAKRIFSSRLFPERKR